MLEARGGIEPPNKGFADLRRPPLTTVESISNSRISSFRPVSVRLAGSTKVGEAFNPWRGACGFYAPDLVSRIGPVVVLATRRKLADGHKALYIRLVRRWGQHGPCFPSYESLASDLGRSVRIVKMWIEDLEAFGLIDHRRRGRAKGGAGQTNEYRFLWHPIFEVQKPANSSRFSKCKNDHFEVQGLALLKCKNEPPLYKEETHTREIRTEKHHREDAALSPIEEAAREAAGFERLSEGDRRFCRELEGLPEETIRAGVILGRARRMVHETNTGTQEPVRSLRYFAATIQEAAKGLPAGYVEHLENWINRKAS